MRYLTLCFTLLSGCYQTPAQHAINNVDQWEQWEIDYFQYRCQKQDIEACNLLFEEFFKD